MRRQPMQSATGGVRYVGLSQRKDCNGETVEEKAACAKKLKPHLEGTRFEFRILSFALGPASNGWNCPVIRCRVGETSPLLSSAGVP
jgi:hypothetical protein